MSDDQRAARSSARLWTQDTVSLSVCSVEPVAHCHHDQIYLPFGGALADHSWCISGSLLARPGQMRDRDSPWVSGDQTIQRIAEPAVSQP